MVFNRTKLRMVRRYRNRGIAVALLLGLAVASGCDITGFHTPGIVGENEVAPLKVDIASLASAGPVTVDFHVMLRVPSDWTAKPAISSWYGTLNGSPASGTPTVSSTNPSAHCDFSAFVGAPPSDMKDVYFSQSFSNQYFLETDKVTLDARFDTGLTGDYTLVSALAFDSGTEGSCADSATSDVRVLTAVPIDQPWALVGLSLGLLAAALLATRRLAPHAFG